MKKYSNLSRIFTFVLIFALLLPCLSMTVSSADIPCAEDGCSGTYRNGICSVNPGHYEAAPRGNGVYMISNAGQLYWFASLINGGSNEFDGDNGEMNNAILTADIIINADLTAEDKLAWVPIGLYTSGREFVRYSGTFNGNGHTIHGLYYDNTKYDGRNAGLFGILDTNGTVKNLTLADSVINGSTEIGGIVSHNYGTVIDCTQSGSVTGTGATGGVVCRNMASGRVENCYNTGTISGSTTGGIVAENNGSIDACNNAGKISGTNSVGGIAGMNDGIVKSSQNSASVIADSTHVGGVVGNLVGGEIISCKNIGSVAGASDYIGGVAGACVGARITESFNTGAVIGAGKSDAVGGIAGAIDGSNTVDSAIISCYNTGSVSGRSWVGGIAGISGYQKTPENVSVANSYNTGAVSGTNRYSAVIGSRNKGTISDTYYQASNGTSIDGASQATAEKFASGEIAYKLNGSTSEGELLWKQTIGTDMSPVFEGETVYYDAQKGYYNKAHTHIPGEAVRENETAATCTGDGSYDSVVYCTACGEKLSLETVIIPALGHDWKSLTCTRCDATRENPFTDVPVGEFYFDPVAWAVEEGVTTGATPTTFDPNGNCQRGQVVTFLWRAMGSPEPETTNNPFTDVKEADFFYKAVLWAYENRITTGIDATHFAPTGECNRAQVVTFLWRAQGEPKPTSSEYPFTDVINDFYFEAMLWAVENGITKGMTATTFGPTSICNRAQVVTFLYRAMVK